MSLPTLGIDVGKKKLYVALLLNAERKAKRKTVSNDAAGHQALGEWLVRQKQSQVHVCLEATSTYGHPVARWLHDQGHRVTSANPKQIKAYGESRLNRTKTDRADALLIAQFCAERRPNPWTPPSPEVEMLQALARRIEALDQMLGQERNRLETAPSHLHDDITAHLDFLKQQRKALLKQIQDHIDHHPGLKQQRDLIASIPGMGEKTAAVILAEIGDVSIFKSARQLAAYAGLTPREHSSGTSLHKKPRLCKIGNARLRKALFMPALAAISYNPVIQVFRQRFLDTGKKKILIVGAIMHKLLRWVFGILKSGQPFDPEIHLTITA